MEMLSNGSSGEAVTKLQTDLAALGYDTGAADGIFGPRTEAAVKAFQESEGLDVDGIAGPKTLTRIGIVGRASGVEAAADADEEPSSGPM